MSALQAALSLAEEHSIPVFPCRPDKKPYTEHGYQDASCSVEGIAQSFERWPDALIGVPTGRASRLLVVDVDPDGADWYREHAQELGAGRVHRTKRGHHLVYRMPAQEIRNSASKIAPGVDVRGEGGYVIWWPAHGHEATGDLEGLTEPPPWLIEQLTPKANGHDRAGKAPEGRIGAGQRNEYLSREAFRLRKQGASVEQTLLALRGLNEARCQPPLEDAELQAIAAGKRGIEPDTSEPPARPRRVPIDWTSLEGREPPAREWIIPHWIPDGHTTLLAGRGGIGKTLLAQHIGAALALGHEYIEPLEPRRVLMWAGEDDEAELWRRQIQISHWMGKPLSELAERFVLHSYVATDITLMAPVFGVPSATPMLEELRQQVADYRPEVVILDNIARLYGGSENDRHAVTTFCALVQGACAPAAVILLGHPAKAVGSEYSGSTAWEGAVRARLYLGDRPPDQESDDDAQVDDNVRYLARRKANYSDLDIRRLRLVDGVLIPGDPPARTSQLSGDFAKDTVRRAVQTLAAKGMHGTQSTASPNYLPKLAKQFGLLETATPQTFTKAMREMILAGDLGNEQVGKNSNRTPKMGLVLR